jgi:hypothetical protein
VKRPRLPTLDETRRAAAELIGRPLTPAEDSAVQARWFAAVLGEGVDRRTTNQMERDGWRDRRGV